MRRRSPSRARKVGPGTRPLYVQAREPHARDDLYLLVVGRELPLPERAPARKAPCLAPVEVAEDGARVEAVHLWITVVFPCAKPECDEPCTSGWCTRGGSAASAGLPDSLAATPDPTTAAAAPSARRLVKDLRTVVHAVTPA